MLEENLRLRLEKSIDECLSEKKQLEKELQEKEELCVDTAKELQLKSIFMENMSHEIRTTIHGVLGSLEIVKENSNLNDKDHKFINAALISGESLLDSVNNILDFTKITDRELGLKEANFNIKELLTEVNSVVRSMSEEKNLKLITEIAEDLPERIKGDSTRLRQIIMNLANNAVKFTNRGEITLQIHPVKQIDEGIILRVEITDTGIGINKETLDKILNIFALSDESIIDQFEDVGLGLAMTKELVRLMDGSINVESIEGKGTHLWVDIPFETIEMNEVAEVSVDSELSSLKVLVVEKQNASRSIFEHYFSMWGIESEFVDNCSEAIEKIHQGIEKLSEFNVVMVDYYMPGAESFELSQMLNTQQHISRVTLSSYNLAEQERQIANIEICLVKPIREMQLKDILLECLKVDKKIEDNIESFNESSSDILLAEDNSVNALLAVTMMEQIGLTVKHVENGQQAINEIKNNHYSLVLMDVHMPVMDGYEATRNIREWERDLGLSAIPIIALTADALVSDKEKCLSAGMNDYLSKPIKQKVLQEVVSKWVGKEALA